MAVDALCRALGIECCWVQTLGPDGRALRLAAECGCSPEIRRELAALNLDHPLGQRVIGLGDHVIVPDLSRDGYLGLRTLHASGYRWTIVVPLMTHRTRGLLGVACRRRKNLREVEELVAVVGSIIGMALQRSDLFTFRGAAGPTPRKPDGKNASARPAKATGDGESTGAAETAGPVSAAYHPRRSPSYRSLHQKPA
ncbi:MAG: GAF domain-containing protein [Dehalococcoidales bacterium]|nr:GAF domain-containing protein [Dehalococcoidales bacterium]